MKHWKAFTGKAKISSEISQTDKDEIIDGLFETNFMPSDRITFTIKDIEIEIGQIIKRRLVKK